VVIGRLLLPALCFVAADRADRAADRSLQGFTKRGDLMTRFDGRVAIITGAASGIGKEIAVRIAAEGGIPVIADIDIAAAEAMSAEIRSAGQMPSRFQWT
jgi:hypothetical protein